MAGVTAFFVVGARVLQIVLGFFVMGFSIVLCTPWEANLGLAVPAACCSCNYAVLGLFALLASSLSPVHWIMVLLLDLTALAFACGAAAVLLAAVGFSYWEWNYADWPSTGVVWPPLVFAWICVALLLASVTRSLILWTRSRRAIPEVQVVKQPEYESWYDPPQARSMPLQEIHDDATTIRPNTTQDHFADAKSTISTRPISTVETTAHWSQASRTPTASILSSDTKQPPSYASPQPSRAPTTIQRKPLY